MVGGKGSVKSKNAFLLRVDWFSDSWISVLLGLNLISAFVYLGVCLCFAHIQGHF